MFGFPLCFVATETKSVDVIASSSTVGVVSSGFGSVAGSIFYSTWGPEFISITVIQLNRRNYAPWAKSVEVYMMAKGLDTYLTDAPPDHKDLSYAT